MCANEQLGGPLHGFYVKWSINMPGQVAKKWIRGQSFIDQVAIATLSSGPTGIEAVGHSLNLGHRDGLWQLCIESTKHLVFFQQVAVATTWEIFWQVDMDHLRERMDAGIGSSGTHEKWRTPKTTKSLEGKLECSGHGFNCFA